MSFTARLSPARVSTAAATALPRWALFVLLIAYIAAGMFGRDPWSADDASGFGVMWTMAHGGLSDWMLPNVAGQAVPEEGPLPFWVGAAFIVALGPLVGEAAAARLAGTLWFAVATTAVWYATYRLTRRDEAQPVAFAFGGEATPRAYGRMLADIAVLLLLATVGVVVRMHETIAEPAALAFAAVALFGLAWSLERPRRGAVVAGAAAGLVALSRGFAPSVWLLAGIAWALWQVQPAGRRRPTLLAATGAAVAVFAIWPIAAQLAPAAARATYFGAWWSGALAQFGLPSGSDLLWLLRNGAWFTWPLWPLAAWTLYAWRHGLRTPHVAVPSILLAAWLLGALTVNPLNDSALMLAVPPLLILACLGATTLRPAADTVMDWFSIIVFSLAALAGWAYFVAALTGVPPKMATSVARQIPGFQGGVAPLAVGLALLATVAWAALVRWRVAVRPPMLWRGPLLAAAGIVTLWVLLVLLALPALNYRRSYAPLAREVAAQVGPVAGIDACVYPVNLLLPHRALFAYHGPIRFAAEGQDCPLLLQRDSSGSRLDDAPPGAPWQPVWQGSWPARPDDVYTLYLRTAG